MTEYWISTKKHYCETCNCWVSDHKLNIRNHERSSKHLENLRRAMNASSLRRNQEAREKESLEKELEKLEKVGKQYLESLNKKEVSNLCENNTNNNNESHPSSFFNSIPSLLSNSHLPNSNCTQNEQIQNTTTKSDPKWLIMFDESTGKFVYLNRSTIKIKREKPEDYSGEVPEGEKFTEENGWHKYMDFYSSNYYYYNVKTFRFMWIYSRSTINKFIAYLKKWKSGSATDIFNAQASYLTSLNNVCANMKEPKRTSVLYRVSDTPNSSDDIVTDFSDWDFQRYLQSLEEEIEGEGEGEREREREGEEEEREGEREGERRRQRQRQREEANIREEDIEREEANRRENERMDYIRQQMDAVSFNINNYLAQDVSPRSQNTRIHQEILRDGYLNGTYDNPFSGQHSNIYMQGYNICTCCAHQGYPNMNSANDTQYLHHQEKHEEELDRNKNTSRWDQGVANVETNGNEQNLPKMEQMKKIDKKNTNSEEIVGQHNNITNAASEKRVEQHKNVTNTNKTNVNGQREVCSSMETDYNCKDNNCGVPGKWEPVENTMNHRIREEDMEEMFYRLKSKEELEQEELSNLENNLKDEYSMYDSFYVKKKELENPNLFINQEFPFVPKPAFTKAADVKNVEKEKVTFVKRSTNTKNKKGDISNAK